MKNYKICFIINPVAGGRDKHLLRERLLREFEKDDIRVEAFFTEYQGHASVIATEQYEKGAEIIVAVGGDGTINEIAKTLIDKEVKLAVIPFGSGNGFARHFGLPLGFAGAVEVLKKGCSKKIDIGMVNGKPFFCTSGLGFDAETGYQFSHFGKRGFFSYAFSFIRVFKLYKSVNYTLYFNNEKIERNAFFINVANISQLGYNFKIAPDASADDGHLDLVIVNKFPKWKGLIMAFQSFLGNIHRNPYVEYHKIRKIKIEIPTENNRIHIDGEPEQAGPEINYSVKPLCLNVILPG